VECPFDWQVSHNWDDRQKKKYKKTPLGGSTETTGTINSEEKIQQMYPWTASARDFVSQARHVPLLSDMHVNCIQASLLDGAYLALCWIATSYKTLSAHLGTKKKPWEALNSLSKLMNEWIPCGEHPQSKEVTRGPPELVQHFRL